MSILRKSSRSKVRRRLSRPDNVPPPVSTAYDARRPNRNLNSVESQAKQMPTSSGASFWLQRSGLLILLFVAVASLVNIFSLSADAKILPLTTSNNSSFLHSEATYQVAASRLLSGSVWNHNKITINTAQLSRQLSQQFPELSSVSVTLPLLAHRPVVYVQTAQPALILATSSKSYVLDTRGKALLASTNPSQLARFDLPVVTDQSGLRVALNRQVLTSSDVSFVQIVIAQLAARHFSVNSMALPPNASELDVHINGQPYFVKFNLQATDVRQQAGTFLATITQLKRQNITPTQYVDVRVDGRAYYK